MEELLQSCERVSAKQLRLVRQKEMKDVQFITQSGVTSRDCEVNVMFLTSNTHQLRGFSSFRHLNVLICFSNWTFRVKLNHLKGFETRLFSTNQYIKCPLWEKSSDFNLLQLQTVSSGHPGNCSFWCLSVPVFFSRSPLSLRPAG